MPLTKFILLQLQSVFFPCINAYFGGVLGAYFVHSMVTHRSNSRKDHPSSIGIDILGHFLKIIIPPNFNLFFTTFTVIQT